jgi:hypothetical protein
MFTRIDDYHRSNGSVLQSGVSIAPWRVIELFGEPDVSDEYKTSMEWLFEDEDGEVVTLYDWKSTSLYSPELPNPDSLKFSAHPHSFHVGAHSYTAAMKFVDWVLLQESKPAWVLAEEAENA